MLDKNVKVPLPEHGIAYKKMGDKTYVYYATAVYRNAKGQPTCDRSSIGRLDEETGMLIPNRNYYEIYLKQPQPPTGAIFHYGVYHVFSSIVKEFGISSLLKKYFPGKEDEILTAAQYMLSEGNVMAYIEDYTEDHETFSHGIVSDKRISELFSSLREEDILLFLREWMGKRKKGEYIAYDVTSVSTYSGEISEAEWGYNRDKEKLPQINLGMYFGEESGLPLYYRMYPGSISDKAHLKYMVEDNGLIGAKKLRYVMDRGFYSKENLIWLTEKGYRFVIALPGSLNYVKDMIRKRREEIVNRSECRLGKGLPYGRAFETTELGFRMKVHLYYDAEKAARESEDLYDMIDAQENELKTMEEPPDRKLHYDRYFYINRSKEGKLGFTRNHKAIDEALTQCGFFAIAETDFTKDDAEILEIYRMRDTVEKSFDDLKNGVDMKRARTHSTEGMHGKLFAAFLALIVRAVMLNRMRGKMDLTQRKVILELDKIRVLDLRAKTKARLLDPVTKMGREILDALGVDAPVPG